MSGRLALPCGVLLAAGLGQRFRQAQTQTQARDLPDADKLMQRLPDGRLVAVAAVQALRAAMPRVLAVVRPDAPALAEALRAEGAEVLIWPPAGPPGTALIDVAGLQGMGDSLACAVRASAQASAWLVALADMPNLRADTVQQVLKAVSAGAQAIAAPVYRGQRGHPVGFGSAHGPQLMELRGDQGPRGLLKSHAEHLVLLPCDDPGVLADIDTPEDLARLGQPG